MDILILTTFNFVQSQYSIRINDQYRICFFWGELGADAVEIVDYH